MARARRHQRLLSALAFGLLALVAELGGRSLTHRADFGRHVRTPSYSHTDYYPVLMGVVCFRARAGGGTENTDALNEAIAAAVNRGGCAYINHTRLRGRVALRIGLGNVLTEERHLRQAWNAIRRARSALV